MLLKTCCFIFGLFSDLQGARTSQYPSVIVPHGSIREIKITYFSSRHDCQWFINEKKERKKVEYNQQQETKDSQCTWVMYVCILFCQQCHLQCVCVWWRFLKFPVLPFQFDGGASSFIILVKTIDTPRGKRNVSVPAWGGVLSDLNTEGRRTNIYIKFSFDR